jgi:alginate O-acetyltransferase complex protein AlgJ
MAQDLLDPIHPGPGQSRVQAALFVGMLVLGGITSLSTEAARTAPVGKDFLKGSWTGAWEHAFDEAMPLRPVGIDTWGALEWFGFRTARRGALVGEGGWMFTSEEFETLPDEAAEVRRKVDFAVDVAGRLKKDGVDLIVALVPAKARVCQDRLGRYDLHDRARYATVRDALVHAGLRVPDLSRALADGGGCDRHFLRTDTHWTAEGARTAAGAVVAALRDDGLVASLPRTGFSTERGPPEERAGDLLRYLPLGPLQGYGPAPDQVAIETTVMKDSGDDLAAALFGDAAGPPVTLVGTSYSLDPTWNFSGALKQALGADVLNLAREAGGPFAPMVAYLAGPEIHEAPPALVVWEIPERYLGVSYDLTLPGAP